MPNYFKFLTVVFCIKSNYHRFFLLAALFMLPAVANAAFVFSAPAQDPDGNYTLSWTGMGSYVTLTENMAGTWRQINGGTNTSHSVSGKPEGSYTYKIENYCLVGPHAPVLCDTVTRTVVVGSAAPTISAISGISINEDTSNHVINFSVNDLDTQLSLLTVSASSSNTGLFSSAGLVLSGSDWNRTLALTPNANASGSTTITLSVWDGAKSASVSFTVTVNAVNDGPTISSIPAKTVNEDSSTGAISFSVNDIESGGALTVSASSNNTGLIPPAGLVLGGSGTARTITATPASNMSGSAIVTLVASDGSLSTSTSFVITINGVNDAPAISDITNRTISEDSSTGAITFSVSDVDTASTSLNVSASSSNVALIPNGNISIGGSGASRTINVAPAANGSGSATITVSVSDGQYSTSDTFVVTVNAVNDAPGISPIANTSINENSTTGNLGFSIADIDTAASNLTVSATSSNTTLIPNANLLLTGVNTARYVSVQPVARVTGTSVITVTVSDGALSTAQIFTVTVVDLPATLFISSTTSTTGIFSLNWDYLKESVKITESRNGGSEYPLPEYPHELSNVFSAELRRESSGVYKYVLYECIHSGSQAGPTTTCTPTSTKTITVTLPLPTLTASLN
ncbi:MAG: Repeat family, partial [Cellvibrio sp.]|nr:Repeat family [Cellvibrio sp.]